MEMKRERMKRMRDTRVGREREGGRKGTGMGEKKN